MPQRHRPARAAAGRNWGPGRVPAGWSHRPLRRRLRVLPYLGYANARRLTVRGRVLRERKLPSPEPHASGWRNFVALARLVNSAKVARAIVRTRFRAREHRALTDVQGYFEFNLALDHPLERETAIEIELVAPRSVGDRPVTARATICVPPPTARFGIISDIDDTIVWTHVNDRRRMVWTLARSNAATRKPFAGVAALYRALRDGAAGDEANPIFYVSSGPWNLYPALLDFLRINDIPAGPMFLKDWGRHMITAWRDHGTHKLAAIRDVMTAYPHLPFVLVGDSGEQDPEIYRDAVREFPTRVAAIYIRSVAASPARRTAIEQLASEVHAAGSLLHLVADSHEAGVHEARAGRIAQRRLEEIRLDQLADRRAPLPAAAIHTLTAHRP
jgi:phosphatidate phosphatase APP1